MKLRSLTFFTAALLGLSLQCSWVPKKEDHTNGNTSMSTAQREDNAESKRRYEAMTAEIDSFSKKLGVESLRAVQEGDEIRIWVGFGVTHPRLFVMKVSDEPKANFYTIRTSPDPNGKDSLDVPESIPLGQPRSGWAEFQNFLKTQGIESPIRLSRERSDYLRSPDVQAIAIETRLGDIYSMVFFHFDNPSEDAQRALTVCRKIELEFNANMYCGTSNQ